MPPRKAPKSVPQRPRPLAARPGSSQKPPRIPSTASVRRKSPQTLFAGVPQFSQSPTLSLPRRAGSAANASQRKIKVSNLVFDDDDIQDSPQANAAHAGAVAGGGAFDFSAQTFQDFAPRPKPAASSVRKKVFGQPSPTPSPGLNQDVFNDVANWAEQYFTTEGDGHPTLSDVPDSNAARPPSVPKKRPPKKAPNIPPRRRPGLSGTHISPPTTARPGRPPSSSSTRPAGRPPTPGSGTRPPTPRPGTRPPTPGPADDHDDDGPADFDHPQDDFSPDREAQRRDETAQANQSPPPPPRMQNATDPNSHRLNAKMTFSIVPDYNFIQQIVKTQEPALCGPDAPARPVAAPPPRANRRAAHPTTPRPARALGNDAPDPTHPAARGRN